MRFHPTKGEIAAIRRAAEHVHAAMCELDEIGQKWMTRGEAAAERSEDGNNLSPVRCAATTFSFAMMTEAACMSLLDTFGGMAVENEAAADAALNAEPTDEHLLPSE